MHRHGYKGRKFGRERDQRRALLKGLATSLIEHGAITTTLPKAKELRPHVESLITKAKKGDLHNRRQVIAALSTLEAAYKLVDEIAPQLTERDGGYLRITRTSLRVGDNAQMARISFVDDLKAIEAGKAATKASAIEEKTQTSSLKPQASKAAKGAK